VSVVPTDDRPAWRLLHVEPDSEVRTVVQQLLADQLPDTAYVGVTDTREATTATGEERVDCVLAGGVADADLAPFLRRFALPTVLYTDADPAAVDDAVLDAADTVVRYGDGWNRDLLAGKLRSLSEPGDEGGQTRYALGRALTRIEEPDRGRTDQFLLDGAGHVEWCSRPFDEVFPVTRAGTVPDGTFDERLHALLADAPSAVGTVSRTRGTEDEVPPAVFGVPVDDGELYFRHTGYRLPDAVGGHRLEMFERVTEDVTRAARMELLEQLVEHAQDGLYTLDDQGNIEFCNSALAEMVGYDREALIGEHASAVLADGELAQGQESLQPLLDGERDNVTVDMTFEARDGDQFEVAINYTLLPSSDGSYAGLMGVARDITDRKVRERRLEQYEQLVEAAREPMYVLDGDGRIELLNGSMATLLEGDRSDLLGRPIASVLPSASQRAGTSPAALYEHDGDWDRHERWLPGPDGTDRLYVVTVGPLPDEEGVVGTLHDITERERRTAELDLLKQVLARVLRHNLRTELTVIQCHAERIVEGTGDPVEAAELVLDSADSLLETAGKAREIERLVESDVGRTTLELSDVVEAAVGDVASDHPQADYVIDVPDGLAVRGHPTLQQGVENLVENAVVHDPADPSVRITATATDGGVELVVADEGPGIPANELAALENRAETPLEHSSGAGLWLVDWIANRSDGELTFETGEDGTTVRLALDRAGDTTT